jgi:hypothetical protein
VHHLREKKALRIATYEDEFIALQQEVKNLLPNCISRLDPNDLRSCGENPELATTKYDDLLEDTASDLSHSIDSLLSLDINGLSLFQTVNIKKETKDEPISEVTMSDTDERF